MDEDTTDAAYAQHECEHRQMAYLLERDGGYEKWLQQLENERGESK